MAATISAASFFNSAREDQAIRDKWIANGKPEDEFSSAYTKARALRLLSLVTLCAGAVMSALSAVFAAIAVGALVSVIGAPIAIVLGVICALSCIAAFILGYKWFRELDQASREKLGIDLATVEIRDPVPAPSSAPVQSTEEKK